jgi:hypothetical protein
MTPAEIYDFDEYELDGVALACCAQAELRLTSPDEAYANARTAALRALAMDASNADAQVALGTVLFLSDWNWTGAQRSLARALAIGPDHTEGWLLYGRLLETLDPQHLLARECIAGAWLKKGDLDRHMMEVLAPD